MVRIQTSTLMHTDNSTNYGIVNNKVHQQCTEAMDIRFYCVKIEFSRAITTSFGNLALLLWQIISPNIIRLIIITEWDHCICTILITQLIQVQGCYIQAINLARSITQIMNKNHEETINTSTHGRKYGQTDRSTDGRVEVNIQQLKCRDGQTTIHL